MADEEPSLRRPTELMWSTCANSCRPRFRLLLSNSMPSWKSFHEKNNGPCRRIEFAFVVITAARFKRRAELEGIFLNFETKFESPDFILPEDKHYTKEELLIPMREIKDKMIAAAKAANLDELAPLPPGHVFEGATKLEMVYFTTYHAIRHNRQIRNIKAKL